MGFDPEGPSELSVIKEDLYDGWRALKTNTRKGAGNALSCFADAEVKVKDARQAGLSIKLDLLYEARRGMLLASARLGNTQDFNDAYDTLIGYDDPSHSTRVVYPRDHNRWHRVSALGLALIGGARPAAMWVAIHFMR